MRIAAYCRVSTDKKDQLNSLKAQKEFFAEYTLRTGDELVKLYADEGISGTKASYVLQQRGGGCDRAGSLQSRRACASL